MYPNVVPFLSIIDKPIHFISAWIPGIKLGKYIANRPDTNWLDIVGTPFSCLGLCLHLPKSIGIANGLDYLHSHDVVHGDLGGVRNCPRAHFAAMLIPRQPNILVNNSGCPHITEFGLTTMFPVSESSRICHCMRWAEPGDWIPSKKSSDVFSFVMVMVEVRHRCWPQTNRWPIYPPPRPRFLPEKFHSFRILNLKWCQL